MRHYYTCCSSTLIHFFQTLLKGFNMKTDYATFSNESVPLCKSLPSDHRIVRRSLLPIPPPLRSQGGKGLSQVLSASCSSRKESSSASRRCSQSLLGVNLRHTSSRHCCSANMWTLRLVRSVSSPASTRWTNSRATNGQFGTWCKSRSSERWKDQSDGSFPKSKAAAKRVA